MIERYHVVIVGSGFAGSLMARVLAVQGYDVLLLERGSHPRFAIGESTTPLANLSLERIARRYGLADCFHLAAHGRWLEHHAELRRGLKRGFTFYRHHPGEELHTSERLLVAASPNDAVSDMHWMRSDVDHHFVRQAQAVGVDYRDRADITGCAFDANGVQLRVERNGTQFDVRADFVIDASGPGGFLARQLSIPDGMHRTRTRSGLVYSHFSDVRLMSEVVGNLVPGPYADDWAAVHHLIDEGWMYSLRFDDGVTSAGFTLSPRGLAGLLEGVGQPKADLLWARLLDRYPTLSEAFADAKAIMPIAFRSIIQHRLTRAAGDRWALLPHAYGFVDPLFSTGIAWGLRAIERLAQCFEPGPPIGRRPSTAGLERYESLVGKEADQIDRMVAGAYDAMAHFELFAAQAMIYFASVSYAETRQRVSSDPDSVAWNGFLGVGDPVLDSLPRRSGRRLRRITGGRGDAGTAEQRREFADWVAASIAPRNLCGFAEPSRCHLYPVDLDHLVSRHALLGLTRDEMVASVPLLRGEPTPRPWNANPANGANETDTAKILNSKS